MRSRFPVLAFAVPCLVAGLAGVHPGSAQATPWQHVAFPACGARTVVFHPTHAETCYAGSQACGAAMEGTHRSGSAGLSWTDLGTAEHSAKSIAIDPKNPRRLWIACPDALYRSVDGGATWVLSMDGISLVPEAEFMTDVAVNPAYPETVYAAKRSLYGLDAIYRSTDHAQSWLELYVPVPGYFNTPYDIEVSDKDPASLYLAMGSYVMVSHNHGDVGSWYTVLENQKVDFRDIALDPGDPNRVYVASLGDAPYGGLYRTVDGGVTWKLLGPSQGLSSNRLTVVTVDPVSPATVYAGTSNDPVAVYRSIDGGDSWEPFDTGLPVPCKINAIAAGPEKGIPLLAATSTDGIYRWDPATATAEEERDSAACGLQQNWPNPFNPSTEIAFSLPVAATARLDIYDVQGRWVRNLVAQDLTAGDHVCVWDGRDGAGHAVGGGVYFYRLRADGFSATRRMVLLR